jgi:hypothetical protein
MRIISLSNNPVHDCFFHIGLLLSYRCIPDPFLWICPPATSWKWWCRPQPEETMGNRCHGWQLAASQPWSRWTARSVTCLLSHHLFISLKKKTSKCMTQGITERYSRVPTKYRILCHSRLSANHKCSWIIGPNVGDIIPFLNSWLSYYRNLGNHVTYFETLPNVGL